MIIPQNSPNSEYKSHLVKNCMIYCCPQFSPLGGTIIKESAFWLITPLHFVTHSKTLYQQIVSLNYAESREIGHTHFRLLFFFFRKYAKLVLCP